MGLLTRLSALAAPEESVAGVAQTSRSDRSASGLASLPRHMNTDPARPPETLPQEIRREILAGVRAQGLKILHKVTILKSISEDEEEI